jgi:hypothetical protein
MIDQVHVLAHHAKVDQIAVLVRRLGQKAKRIRTECI